MDTPHFLSIDGQRLSYSLAGCPHNPPLILVHGWLSHRGVWRTTLPLLEAHYYCVSLDLLGFGDSDKPQHGDYSLLAQGRRVLALADALGFERFTLLGHSMGGQIALCTAALLAPGRITRLVSVAGVVSGRLLPYVERLIYPGIALLYRFPSLAGPLQSLLRYRWYVNLNFRPWFYDMDAIPFAEWEIDRRMATRPDLRFSAYAAGQAIHSLDLTPHLPKISAPALAIFGAQDGTVPVSDGRLVQQHVPGARLALLERCGHFPMYEQREGYLEALGEFMGVGD